MTRTEIINAIIAKRGYETYLEIGVRNPGRNFNNIKAPVKVGVDPKGKHEEKVGYYLFQQTSDAFFASQKMKLFPFRKKETFDIIFIDGDHRLPQAKKDIANALKHLAPGGTIVVHDCNPITAKAAAPEKPKDNDPWNGEVYKAFIPYRRRKNLFVFTIDCDHGVGIIRRGETSKPAEIPRDFTFGEFKVHADTWLGLVPPSMIKEII